MSRADIAKNLAKLFPTWGNGNASAERDLIMTSHRVLGALAKPLVAQMGLSDACASPVAMLDSACGSGVLTQEAQAALPEAVRRQSSFLCADKAEELVGLVKKRAETEGWANVKTEALDATNTGLPDNSLTHVGIALGLHLIPDPDAVLKGTYCQRILKPAGIFGASTFHQENVFWQRDVRSAFASFPFSAPFPEQGGIAMQLHNQGEWTNPTWIEAHLKAQGFSDVQVVLDRSKYRIESADEFLSSFGLMLPLVMNTWWDEVTRQAHPLEEVRELLKKHLEEKYEGQGWDIEYSLIRMTGRVDK